MLARLAKRAARSIRDAAMADRVRRRKTPPQASLTILTYHRILPRSVARDELVEPGMYVTPETFGQHLRIAKRFFTPIRLRDWPEAADNGTDRPYIALTFDDGWLDNSTYAMSLLQQHAVPATVFLVTRAADQSLVFWTDRLSQLYRLERGRRELASSASIWIRKLGVPAAFFDAKPSAERVAALINTTKKLDDAIICDELDRVETRATESMPEFGRKRMFLNWHEAASMAETGLVDFGSHSVSHQRLDMIDDKQKIEREVIGSRETLQSRFGDAFCDVFCYPNGNIGEDAEKIVRNSYKSACTVVRGVNYADGDPYRLQRVSVHEDATRTPNGFLSNLVRH